MKEPQEFPDHFMQNNVLTLAQEENPQALGKFLLGEQETYTDNTSKTESQHVQIPHQEGNAPPKKNIKNEFLFKGESIQQRASFAQSAENPLLEIVQPLLRTLSDIPKQIEHIDSVVLLKKILINEISLFSMVCDEADIPWKKMAIVRYCICTALDEAVHATPWGLAAGWSQSNLLNHFEGDNDGGNKFFLLIGRLSMTPHEYVDVLEVLLRILGLGFEGRYSIIKEGDRQLTKIRQRLLTIIQTTREPTPSLLSPHGLAVHGKKRKERLMIPVRVTALLFTLMVASVFILFKYWISVGQHEIEQKIYRLHRAEVVKPAPIKAERLTLSILLKNEIQKKLVSVDEALGKSKVIFNGDTMFMVGSSQVRPEMSDILKRVSQEVQRVKGSIVIVGHTDSTPIARSGFSNNQQLSEKRAENVAQYFIEAGIPSSKIKIKGAGETQPISSNQTKEGRAQNRRVEIFVTY